MHFAEISPPSNLSPLNVRYKSFTADERGTAIRFNADPRAAVEASTPETGAALAKDQSQ
jgi:hypothetical protein